MQLWRRMLLLIVGVAAVVAVISAVHDLDDSPQRWHSFEG